EVDFGAITIAKSFADPAGHYARPDVTRMILNASPVTPVEVVQRAQENEEEAESDMTHDVQSLTIVGGSG
ncbi:MAG: hypothetical protein OXS28_05045, partial [Gammaproteobacteria bacterium]|nr:hypothetical protein [Gammaproteobacteria bacterium]